MNIWIILLAAGEGSRLKEYLNTKKQFFVWKNRPIFWHSAKTFNNIPILKGIIFVVPPEEKDLSHQISHLAL